LYILNSKKKILLDSCFSLKYFVINKYSINLINKSNLTSDNFYGYSSYGEGNMYARLFLFVGFAALAGGLAGSFVCISQTGSLAGLLILLYRLFTFMFIWKPVWYLLIIFKFSDHINS
jgi:hypothetical protein